MAPEKDDEPIVDEEDTDDDIHNHLRMMNEDGEIDEAFDDFSAEGDIDE